MRLRNNIAQPVRQRTADWAMLALALLGLTLASTDVAHAQRLARPIRPTALEPHASLAPIRVRPISDFIDVQGQTAVFYPPAPDYAVGFTTATCTFPHCPGRIAIVDYTGGANRFLMSQGYGSLGTRVEGSIVEVPLSDGRVQVTVVLHTTNALTFASEWDASPPPNAIPGQSAQGNTRLFGYSIAELLQDRLRARPSLGASHLVFSYKTYAPGAPLPDLVKLFALGTEDPRIVLDAFYFDAKATGTLHAAANLGREGTFGELFVLQIGLFTGPVQGPDFGFFPDAERVDLRPLGH